MWYRNILFRGIIIMCEKKYLNKQMLTFYKIFRKIIFDTKQFKKLFIRIEIVF